MTIGFRFSMFRHLLAAVACGLVSLLLSPALTNSGAESADGFYSIHLSTFKGVRDAGREVSHLEGQGFEAFHKLESIDGRGEMYRVYVGRHPTREEAKKAVEAMKQKGVITYYAIKRFTEEIAPIPSEVVTKPTEPSHPPEPALPEPIETAHGPASPVNVETPMEQPQVPKKEARIEDPPKKTDLTTENRPPVSGTRFFSIHVSTFKGVRDAGREVSRLEGSGCEPFHRLESIDGKGEMYRVYVGRYGTREEAGKASDAMMQKGFVSYAFVKSFREKEAGPASPATLTEKNALIAMAAQPQLEPSPTIKEATPLPHTGTMEKALPKADVSPLMREEKIPVFPGQEPSTALESVPEPAPVIARDELPGVDAVSESAPPVVPSPMAREKEKEKVPAHPPEEPSTSLKRAEPSPGGVQEKPPEHAAVSETPAPAPLSPPEKETGGKVHQMGQRSRDILRIPLERRPHREIVRLSLLDAIRYSIAGNKEMEIASYEPELATEDVARSNSVYDPSFFLEDRHSRGPNINSDLDNIFVEDSSVVKSGIRQPLATGGTLSLFMEMDYFDTRNELLDRNYRYTSAPIVELRQPLLKNLGSKAEKSAIRVANCSLNISEENFRQTVIDTVTRVSQAYWMLYLHHEYVRIHRENVKMAEEVYRREFYRLDQGLSKDLDVERARAALEERRGNLLRSEERSRVTLDLLKNELNWSNLKIDSAAGIVPMERPKTLPEEVDESKVIQKALLNRPEILKSQKNLEIAVIREDLSSHERLPSLDAFARYGLNGYGREFSTSFDDVESGDRTSWIVGLTFEWPIGNRSANALHRRRILEKKQKMSEVEKVENQVKREVKEAIHGIELAKGDIESTLSRMESAEKVVEGEFARFDLGQVANEELLRAQDLLTSARREFVRAVIDYNISLAQLNRAQGILVDEVILQKTASLREEPLSQFSTGK